MEERKLTKDKGRKEGSRRRKEAKEGSPGEKKGKKSAR